MSKKNHKNISLSLDDYGMNALANKNILKLAAKNPTIRVSIMIDGKISDDQIRAIKKTGAKLDLHLTIAARNPYSQKKQKGLLKRSASFLKNYLVGKISKANVELEWTKQVEKFQELFGQKPDGINSHEHIHFFPAYFSIILKLASEYNIPYVRYGNMGILNTKKLISRILQFLWKKNKEKFFKYDLSSSEYLVSLDWIKHMDKFLDDNKKANIEIVCHPERKKEFELIRKYF